MASRPLSQHPILLVWAILMGLIVTGFGINGLLRPANAIAWFEIDPPPGVSGDDFFELIMPVYAARNIYVGVSIFAAAYYRAYKVLGWNIFAIGLVAVVDGLVCWRRGQGHDNHWGYAPQLLVLGPLLMGVLDGRTPLDREKKE